MKADLREIPESESVILHQIAKTDEHPLFKNIYPSNAKLYLHSSTIEKLIQVADFVYKQSGYKMCILDAYRPLRYQKHLLDICKDFNPDNMYVSSVDVAFHCRGVAVAVAFNDHNGDQMLNYPPMSFDAKAHHGTTDGLTTEQIENRNFLKSVMIANGFESYEYEWWHYNLVGWDKFDVLDIGFDELAELIPYQLPTGKLDDARLSAQNLTLEKLTYKHIADAGINSESVVVDLGCGNGDIVCHLLPLVKKIIAIDSSQEQLDLTKSKVDAVMSADPTDKLADVEYICTDIRNNGNLLLGEVDVIFMRFVLIHNETHRHSTILDNIKQMLKPGGVIVNEETVWDNIECSHCPDVVNEYKTTLYNDNMAIGLDFNTGKFLNKLYETAGFNVEYFEIIDRPITYQQLKMMYQSIMKIKRSKTSDLNKLVMFDRWDEAMSSVPENDPRVQVRTSGTGCLTARKPLNN